MGLGAKIFGSRNPVLHALRAGTATQRSTGLRRKGAKIYGKHCWLDMVQGGGMVGQVLEALEVLVALKWLMHRLAAIG